jgi:hypothetical protein
VARAVLKDVHGRRTAICVKPFRAARCKLVLLLSSKSGLRSLCGLLRMMRCTRGRSLSRMARRRRRDTSILCSQYQTVAVGEDAIYILIGTWHDWCH